MAQPHVSVAAQDPLEEDIRGSFELTERMVQDAKTVRVAPEARRLFDIPRDGHKLDVADVQLATSNTACNRQALTGGRELVVDLLSDRKGLGQGEPRSGAHADTNRSPIGLLCSLSSSRSSSAGLSFQTASAASESARKRRTSRASACGSRPEQRRANRALARRPTSDASST